MNRKKRNDHRYKFVITRPGNIKFSVFSIFRRESRKKYWDSSLRYDRWVVSMADQMEKEIDERIVNAIVKYGAKATIENVFE